jgi:hypothetical protein
MADGRANAFGRNAEPCEELRSEALFVVNDREQEILRHDGIVPGGFVDR